MTSSTRPLQENQKEGSAANIILSDAGNIIRSGKAVVELLGAEEETFIHRDFRDFLAPSSVHQWESLLRAVRESDEEQEAVLILKATEPGELSKVRAMYVPGDPGTGWISLIIETPIRSTPDEDSALLGQILDQAYDEIYLCDAESLRFISVNRRACENLGYSMEELTRMTPLDLKSQFSHNEFITLITPLLEGTKSRLFFSTIHTRRDGSTYPAEVHLHKTIIRGRATLLAVILDITGKTAIETELRENERKYQNLYRYAQVGLFETSLKDATVIACNQRYVDLIGYPSVEEAIGRDVLAAYENPDDRIEIARIIREQGYIKDQVTRFVNLSTRRKFWAQFSARYDPCRDVAEGSIIDITPLKESEEALRESEEKYRLLVNNVNEAIIVAQEGRCIMLNPSMITLVGYPESVLLHRDFTDFIHPDDRELVLNRHYQRMRGEEIPARYPFRIIRADGDARWVEIHSVRFEWNKEPATLNILIDITDLKQNEEALQEANHKLRLLTSITRHDIFNHLNTISLLLGLAISTYDQEKSCTYLKDALQVTDRIDAITRFTREFEDFGTISPGWYRVDSLIREAITEISSSEIKIENTIPADLEIYTEPIIRKVFTTLMENAIRHGGSITMIRFSSSKHDQGMIITCEDDGVGIPDAEKESVFEHGVGKHTGIGLYLAREILSITGLQIRETGTEGEGARFEILVPHTRHRTRQEPASDTCNGSPSR